MMLYDYGLYLGIMIGFNQSVTVIPAGGEARRVTPDHMNL